MRNIFVLLICLSTATISFAQIDVRTNPINAIFGNPDISAEFSAAPQFGVEIVANPILGGVLNFSLPDDIDYRRRGFKGFIAGKYYFNEEKGMDNLSVGLYLKGKYVNYSAKQDGQSSENAAQNKVALGVLVGQKWVSDNNITFGVDLGIGRSLINRINLEDEESATVDFASVPFFNFDGILRVSIGYRFGGQ
ncbi:MAG: DUF3575 domain-containing protein [Bacteroidota bacterium]